MINNEQKYDNNGKAVRAYQVVEVQPNGELLKKEQFSSVDRAAAFACCAERNAEWNHAGVEYFVRTLRFA